MVYRKLARNEDITSETGLIQTAAALDAAAVVAETQNDVEGLLNVAAMWMKFSEAVSGFTEQAEKEIVRDTESKFEVGFQRSKPQEEEIIVEEENE